MIPTMGILLIAVLSSYVLAHLLKVFSFWYSSGTFNLRVVILPGGMPSAHTALVTGVATAVFLAEGLSSVFLVALSVAVIVMYDAITLRREVSAQKKLLDLLNEKVLGKRSHTILSKEHIGHTPLQVLIGAIVGIVITWATWYLLVQYA